MSNRLPSNGLLRLVVPAADRVAVWSRSPFKVYQLQGQPNFPEAWNLLQAVAADTEYRSAAFATGAVLRIDAGPADVLYASGVTAVITENLGRRAQPAPGVLNATGTLTALLIATGIVTSTTALATTATLDTGTVMDAALDMIVDEAFDWAAINTGGANAFTVTASAGHTLEGSGVVALTSSAVFRTRKTAANTFVTSRLG
jgi:uncharacterized protein YaiE (UPF0345 family)